MECIYQDREVRLSGVAWSHKYTKWPKINVGLSNRAKVSYFDSVVAHWSVIVEGLTLFALSTVHRKHTTTLDRHDDRIEIRSPRYVSCVMSCVFVWS